MYIAIHAKAEFYCVAQAYNYPLYAPRQVQVA